MLLNDKIVVKLLKLPFAPHRFFQLPDEAIFVDVARLEFGRCRPRGVVNANHLMVQAHRGEIPKRGPVSVRAMGRRHFWVLDGNSSAVNCVFSGWSAIPVLVEDEPRPTEASTGRKRRGPTKGR